jgi:hypothetical protein
VGGRGVCMCVVFLSAIHVCYVDVDVDSFNSNLSTSYLKELPVQFWIYGTQPSAKLA